MAKNPGKKFEEDFVKSIPDRCDITRLKDGGGWSDATNTRFTSSNPCDFIVYSHRRTGCSNNYQYKLELKSLKGKSLPYGNIKPSNEKFTALERSIKFTKALVESENKGVMSAFIVNFRDVDQTYIANASDILDFLETADRSSIPIKWFETNGTMIQQSLIRVRWKYDLSWL